MSDGDDRCRVEDERDDQHDDLPPPPLLRGTAPRTSPGEIRSNRVTTYRERSTAFRESDRVERISSADDPAGVARGLLDRRHALADLGVGERAVGGPETQRERQGDPPLLGDVARAVDVEDPNVLE